MDTIKPSFLGIGGMKCGTTWVSECLREHPEVFMSSPKELDYFSTQQYWERGSEWYLGHFAESGDRRVIGEFSTSYVRSTQTPPEKMIERIRGLLDQVRIIAAVRDPVARYRSHLKHLIREGRVRQGTDVGVDELCRINEAHPQLLLFGKLSEPIERFREAFGDSNVYVIGMERCRSNPATELRALYRFLGVNEEFLPSITNKTVSKGIVPRYMILEKARLRVARFFYRRSPGVIDVVKQLGLSDLYRRLNASKARSASLLSTDAECFLRETYAEERSRLAPYLVPGGEE